MRKLAAIRKAQEIRPGMVFLRHAYSRYLMVKERIEPTLLSRGGKPRALTKKDFSQLRSGHPPLVCAKIPGERLVSQIPWGHISRLLKKVKGLFRSTLSVPSSLYIGNFEKWTRMIASAPVTCTPACVMHSGTS